MLSIDHLDVLPVMRPTSVTLAIDLEPEELEMALASNGASLQEPVMMASSRSIPKWKPWPTDLLR